ncbi:MAG: hypothetical protein GVY07_09330 [Bacteroidetes bacterium]|jgi:TolB-like protein/DNA-binding SARP family transcriptional activator/Tfp pilus assembly protein PilF|nr:hypothetical protein [Bacteroidota bacterium]
MVKLSILGPVKLRREDGSLDDSFLKGSKRLALLAFLILKKPRGFHRRDEILGIFWPEHGQKSARNALNNMLYQIRNSLGKESLVSRGTEEISINREKVWCDALAFEELLEEGEVQKAFDLYRDTLLLGLHVKDVSNDFQNWLDAERERLRNLASKAAWALTEKANEKGSHSNAVKWAKKAAALTPFSEDAQARLISLLKKFGYRTEAIKAYEKYEDRLRSEWKMEPSKKLKALVEETSQSSQDFPQSTDPRNAQTSSSQKKEASAESSENTIRKFSSQIWWPAVATLIAIATLAGWMLWDNTPAENEVQPSISERSVAVLPFTYLSAEDSTDYFSLGMTEEILTRLAQIEDLSVISRTSVMQYTNTEKNLQVIAQELGVGTVVEGSVQRVGDQVRITAQLIDANTDHHLWSESYNRPMRNILSIQSEVATSIAEALQAKLIPQERQHLTTSREVNEEAYLLYLQGQHLRDRRDSTGLFGADSRFREAIALDSTFAPSYGGLAMNTFWLGLHGWQHGETAILKTLEAANRALAIDSTIVEAHLAKALVHQIYHHDWKKSEQIFKKAMEINPGHSHTRSEYGMQLLRLGRVDEALEYMRQAVNIDPRSYHAHHGLGYAYLCKRQYEEAINEMETAISMQPEFHTQKLHLYHALLKYSQRLYQEGKDEEAEMYIERIYDHFPESPEDQTLINMVIRGQEEQAIEQLDEFTFTFPGKKMHLMLLLGQNDEALSLIDKVIMPFNVASFADPMFDPVRDDSRFEQMVERGLGVDVDVYNGVIR